MFGNRKKFEVRGAHQAFILYALMAAPLFLAHSVWGENALRNRECKWGACLFVKYDSDLTIEAEALIETLRLRLCKQNVQVIAQPFEPRETDAKNVSLGGPTNECPSVTQSKKPTKNLWWVAHLNASSADYILVAIDHLGSQSNDDIIREVPKGPEPTATAWTIALIIEEAMAPYLSAEGDQAPLGAGLAIIEPPAVGGTQKASVRRRADYPSMRYVGLGLAFSYLGTQTSYVNGILLGPVIGIQAFLGPKFVTSLNAGWMGAGTFQHETEDDIDIKGVVSYVPFELLFGYTPFSNRFVDLAILGGFSTGFSILKIASSIGPTEYYFNFNPWILARVEVTLHIYRPLAVYINGGAGLPISRDQVTNMGQEIFLQDIVIPCFALGIQLWI